MLCIFEAYTYAYTKKKYFKNLTPKSFKYLNWLQIW